MREVEPKVFLVAEPVITVGMLDYLAHVGVPSWFTLAASDAEELIEVMGRLCYRSFEPGLNANIKKIRKEHSDYIANILKVGHGSVIEHAFVSFIFADVSRVFTHELVRHRPGIAISQESLRFVRLTDLGQWLPTCIREDETMVELYADTFEHLEKLQLQMAEHFDLDEEGVPFSKKKEVTSAMRRIAPMGLATSIGWTVNLRTLRWVLEVRTNPGAEEEIRAVFGRVGEIVTEHYPNVFGDFEVEEVNGYPHYKAKHQKV